MLIIYAAVAILAVVFMLAGARMLYVKRRNKRQIPKESLRSLIIEGVVKVAFTKVDWNSYNANIVAPIPLIHSRNAQNYLVLSYIDGSSPTVIHDGNLGELCLTN